MRCQTMLLVAQADNLSIVIHRPIPWYGSSAQIEAWKTVRQPDSDDRPEAIENPQV